MNRRSHLMLVLALLALIIVMAVPARAAQRSVAPGFFGVTDAGLTGPGITAATLDQQMALMAGSGVETVRITREWSGLEPARGVYTWENLDPYVAAAARHGLSVLLNITATPTWASPRPGDVNSRWFPPKNPAVFADFMRQTVLRYGPHGSFWSLNPHLARVPIRQWQIWNEENARFFWVPSRWAPGYVRLLGAAYRAIHRADRGATVVAGSFVGAPESPWNAASDFYRAGGKPYFDEVSVHPFTNDPTSVSRTAGRVLDIVRRVRAVMDRHGDQRKPIIVTEMTWTAALGRVPRKALLGFETTPHGQALRLQAAYSGLVRARRALNIAQVYWFTWTTPYTTNGQLSNETFYFSGLTRIAGARITPLPILKAYSNVAARYEGCHKSADARRCRRQ